MKIVITVKDTDNVIGLKEDIAMRLEGVADVVRIDTADVVPKSEYDEVLSNWQKIHDSYTTDCIDHYNKGRTEVAREIFEEIESIGKVDNSVFLYHRELAELKKKYTEEHK